MARSNNNVVTHGLSGKIGDLLIFIQRFGKTFVSKIPVRSDVVSAKQFLNREKFVKATRYAQASMNNTSLKALYEKNASGDVRAFHFAISDYFKAPVIEQISTEGYNGIPGNILELTAHDNVKVSAVSVEIFANNGALIESGSAIEHGDQGKWIYTTTALNSSFTGSRIKIYARDHPGNVTQKEIVL